MLRRLAGSKFLLLGCVAAVVFLLLAAGLPHSHVGAHGAHSHSCVACRAQSVQPAVDSIAAAGVSPLPYAGLVLPPQNFLIIPKILQLFQSRAPPSFPR